MRDTTKYPVGIQHFGEIIRNGYVYVDKTALLRQLIDSGKYYFLSRPRRFGKSLLLSTIAAYFSGKKELFKGLAIADQTCEWPEDHPVLHVDLGNEKYTHARILHDVLNNRLNHWEELYGKREDETTLSLRFAGIIERAWKRKNRQVVILVDEYDKPLLDAAEDEKLAAKFRDTLQSVYSNLKSRDEYIRFALLTGVTKFSKLSVFSALNNLQDLSMRPQYATLCGITEKELLHYFDAGINRLAENNGMSREQALDALKTRYDGYHFAGDLKEGVYNPFSLLSALNAGGLEDYWFETGTPTFLTAMLRRDQYRLEDITTDSIAPAKLNALDTLSGNPMPILYQSGYLTLAKRHPRTGNFTLRFPNEEVERGFFQMLLPLYVNKHEAKRTDTLLDRLLTGLDAGRPDDCMVVIQALLADVPYEKSEPGEIYFRNLLFIIFRLIGLYCEVEHPMAGGRSDMVIKTDQYIYVLELKVDQSAGAALRQIEDKGYAAPYAADKRRLFKIGVNFSGKEKRINEWRVAEA